MLSLTSVGIPQSGRSRGPSARDPLRHATRWPSVDDGDDDRVGVERPNALQRRVHSIGTRAAFLVVMLDRHPVTTNVCPGRTSVAFAATHGTHRSRRSER